MATTSDQPTDTGSVRFAPRLTEDSLPVTLPKDADKTVEATSSSDQAVVQPESEDRRVSAGVLDLQLVPQASCDSAHREHHLTCTDEGSTQFAA